MNKLHLIVFLDHKDILMCYGFLKHYSGPQSRDKVMLVALLVPKHQDAFFASGNQEIAIFGEVKGSYWLGMPMVDLAFRDHFIVFQTNMWVKAE
jgi:hypothetical protein